MPYFLATAAVESWLPPTSEVTSTPGMRFSASRCFWPKAPWPATQIFIDDLYLEVTRWTFWRAAARFNLAAGFLAAGFFEALILFSRMMCPTAVLDAGTV